MLVIDFVHLFIRQSPFIKIDFREKGVGIGESVMDAS